MNAENKKGSRVEGRESDLDVRCSTFDVRCSMLLLFLAGLWTLDFGLWTCPAQSTNASRLDYSSFRIIADRNIFNPRRSARSALPDRTRRTYTPTDSFGLVGTMNYHEKGPFAFFEGSSPDYRKVLKQDDTIAGFKVAAIAPSYVKLASSTNEVELHIGMQLRHEEDGQWHVSALPESTPTPAPSSSSRPQVTASSSQAVAQNGAPPINAAESEAPPGPDDFGPAGVAEPPPLAPGAEPAPASGGSESDVLERMRRRAAAERGENP
jgi:hypothetical protein